MRILIDTREQRPFPFIGETGEPIPTERATLATGDYSLEGYADRVAVERKSLPDLVACLSHERGRFKRQLERGSQLEAFAVVVEASFEDLAAGRYRSRLNPHAACQSVMAFSVQFGTPFFFAGSRKAAEYATVSFLRQFRKQDERKAEDAGEVEPSFLCQADKGEDTARKTEWENGGKVKGRTLTRKTEKRGSTRRREAANKGTA